MQKTLTSTQETRMDTAENLVADQVTRAVDLLNKMFPQGDGRRTSPELLAAVVKAMGVEYAAAVAVYTD